MPFQDGSRLDPLPRAEIKVPKKVVELAKGFFEILRRAAANIDAAAAKASTNEANCNKALGVGNKPSSICLSRGNSQ